MSAAGDIVILTEYAEWAEERTLSTPENRTSVAAFVEERENRANARRIADALAIITNRLEVLDMRQGKRTSDDADSAVQTLEAVLSALEDDRPSIDVTTYTDLVPKRVFT